MFTNFARVLKLSDDRSVKLVWFDSKLQNLMLPALPRPSYVNEADEKYYEPISVGKMVEKYFGWVGDVSIGKRSRASCAILGILCSKRTLVGGTDEGSYLEVRVRGPGDTETSWRWGGQE